jgi:sugar (pentulose or hexulose) kinase
LAGRSVESKVLWSEILTAVRMALEKAEKMGMLSAVSSDSMMVDLKVVK